MCVSLYQTITMSLKKKPMSSKRVHIGLLMLSIQNILVPLRRGKSIPYILLRLFLEFPRPVPSPQQPIGVQPPLKTPPPRPVAARQDSAARLTLKLLQTFEMTRTGRCCTLHSLEVTLNGRGMFFDGLRYPLFPYKGK